MKLKEKKLAELELYCIKTKNLAEPNFNSKSVLSCVSDRFRNDSPQILKEDGIYKVHYRAGSKDIVCDLKYAGSKDDFTWIRRNEVFGFQRTTGCWGSYISAYLSVIGVKGRRLMFYKESKFAHDGFGYIEIV